ncbi:MAG: glycosyltransferase family protein [Anaerolineae bacterium]|nr:glycosyltransferase family protein [Phycisphaerae bacterium]
MSRAESLHNDGIAALRAKNFSAAIDLISQAIALDPRNARYHVNRGEAYRQANQAERALADFRRATELDPSNATAHYNLGLALRAANEIDESIAHYREAIGLKPDYVKAHYNLANTLRARGDLVAAEQSYRNAMALNPEQAEPWNNLGELLSELMRIDEATAAFDRAIGLKSDHAGARYNRGFLDLLRGEYRTGWDAYEWRWRMPLFANSAPRFAQPMWDGSDLAGKTILLLGEQGVGDNIQFARYATLIAERGGRVVLRCQKSVASLLATIRGVERAVDETDPLPNFDTWIPMMSLPRVFGTTLENVPSNVPYVFPDPQKVEDWRSKIGPHRSKLNIGLAWAGNANQANDRNRSANLSLLQPLAGVADTKIFSLQKGPATSQIGPSNLNLIDLTNGVADFSDTAALIANLDVVVSVCTSVAHVAGAMGKPTLTMLCYNADWRWLMRREDSPWYPTMKLFRQEKQGDWESVAIRVRDELLLRAGAL